MPPKAKAKRKDTDQPGNTTSELSQSRASRQSRHRSSSEKQQLQQQHTANNKPNWPPLRPLIPSSDLSLEPLLDDQIYLIRRFFTSSLCKTYVSCLSSLPLITTARNPKKGEAVRVNDRFQIHDAGFAESLWSSTALKQLVLVEETRRGGVQFQEGEIESEIDNDEDNGVDALWGGRPLGLNPNIRIYRYVQGQFFARHYDESNTLHFSSPSPDTETTIPARTTWTLLIYLTATEGGETVFYEDASTTPSDRSSSSSSKTIAVAPEVGMALLHRHGERCLLHEGKEVRKGVKWVIRSDLVVAR